MVDYEFTEGKVPKLKEFKEAEEGNEMARTGPRVPDLGRMNGQREAKLAGFR